MTDSTVRMAWQPAYLECSEHVVPEGHAATRASALEERRLVVGERTVELADGIGIHVEALDMARGKEKKEKNQNGHVTCVKHCCRPALTKLC